MKRLQRKSFSWGSPQWQAKLLKGHKRQNAFALRYGFTIIYVMINLLLISIALTLAFLFAIYLFEKGLLTLPDRSTRMN